MDEKYILRHEQPRPGDHEDYLREKYVDLEEKLKNSFQILRTCVSSLASL